MQVGDVRAWERTFTEEDVRLFSQISGDQGEHHVTPDARGRLMVHGLLTATLPTKLGGDMHYIARDFAIKFIRPVFAGDTIHCETTITHLERVEGRIQMAANFVCRNQLGKEVLTGHTQGIIRS